MSLCEWASWRSRWSVTEVRCLLIQAIPCDELSIKGLKRSSMWSFSDQPRSTMPSARYKLVTQHSAPHSSTL